MNELEDDPVALEFSVQWGDMDSAGHVNNVIYLRWCESARIEYFKLMGMDISFKGTTGPILGWQDCKYIYPLTFPDTAIATCKVVDIKEDRFMMDCRIYSKDRKRIAAISNQSIIPYDYQKLCKANIPQEWLHAMYKLQKELK